jgi:Mn2+/Fe2+ NRAMP family transporter
MAPTLSPAPPHEVTSPRRTRRLLRSLGPGLITGAADDDPAGIATYSMAGAQFGLGFLWLAPFTWPLMAAVETMCARIGMVTGCGLMDALRLRFSRKLLALAALALFGANTFNIGADLSGMGDAAELLTGVSSHIWVIGFGATIAWATMALHYAMFARLLKWLTLALLAYVAAAFLIGPDWGVVLRATVVPRIPSGDGAWAMVLAILGTTISPYLFFWQASEEVEEEKALGRALWFDRVGATHGELVTRNVDVAVGAFFSNLAFFFITLTTALTLHPQGITQPQTSAEVAAALRPIAGEASALLYTIGLLGTGALAIPTLAGSAAYALAELLNWREGIDERPSGAPGFYSVFVLSIGCAMLIDFADLGAVRALYWSAILNGMLAPFLLVGILAIASDPNIMAGQPSSRTARVLVFITTLLMFVAAAALLFV